MERGFRVIDPERMYETVYQLHGTRCMHDAPERLNAAADYIHREMEKIGLPVREQTFTVPGSDFVFRNIEARLGPVTQEPAAVLVAHYDTPERTYGANDNAASIALMLDIARLLQEKNDPPPLYLVAVSLEETNNQPAMYGEEIRSARLYGIIDDQYIYTTWNNRKMKKRAFDISQRVYNAGGDQGQGYLDAIEELKGSISSNMKAHLLDLARLYRGVNLSSAIGLRSRIGSNEWVMEALKEKKKISYAIALDELGIAYDKPFTQKLSGMESGPMAERYKVDLERRVANFTGIISTASSKSVGERFFAMCQIDEIDMPCLHYSVPGEMDFIISNIPQALGSDHAPFVREGIPAVMIMDTSKARDPWVHTLGDSIDKINFSYLSRLAAAVLETIQNG